MIQDSPAGNRPSIDLISHLAPFSRTGKMPVPQRVNFLVEQASCLFIKDLLRMMQHLISYSIT